MRAYLEIAAKNGTLVGTGIATILILFFIIPNLPIHGQMLDVMFNYSFDVAMSTLGSYGDVGRTNYAWSSMTIDTLLPLVYITCFSGLIYRFRPTDSLRWLAFIPVFAGMCDLLENVQITTMLIQYPDINSTQVTWASTFTMMKHSLNGGSLVLALILIVISGLRKILASLRSH